MSFFEKVKYEFSLLGGAVKIFLRVLFYGLIFYVSFKIFVPFVRYYLSKDMNIEDYENISGFIIIVIICFSVMIGRFLKSLFKNDSEQ